MSKKHREPQDRGSHIGPGPLTPEQAMAGIFKTKPEDVKRIRYEEKKLKGGTKKGGATVEQKAGASCVPSRQR